MKFAPCMQSKLLPFSTYEDFTLLVFLPVRDFSFLDFSGEGYAVWFWYSLCTGSPLDGVSSSDYLLRRRLYKRRSRVWGYVQLIPLF